MPVKSAVDVEAYVARTRGPCFVCRLLAGDPDYAHHVFYEDAEAIGFLSKYPMLRGYALVCPKAHREQVSGDFTRDEYLRLQTVVYEVAEALRRALPVERVYVLSLGSQQGNRHVHWHVAPLPPGVPYEDQQFAALDLARGVLPLSDEEMADLAGALRAELAGRL